MSRRWSAVQPWVGTVARLVLGAFLVYAGTAKARDLPASIRATNAYELLPDALARLVGAGLPFAEIALGTLLLVGLAVRATAAICTVLLTMFVAAIASAWGRGLRIDCGCFGGGGPLDAGERADYLTPILRDGALLIAAVLLLVWPRTRFSIDGWILAEPEDVT